MGVGVLDAPVSGGPAKAAAGELAIMVGGPPDVFERCRPVLEALASHLVHVGPTGHGEIAKLVNNLMGAVIAVGIAEGLTLAAKSGADVRAVCDAVAGGSGSSWILREWIPETVFEGDYHRRFSLDLMRKDMGLISELAGSLGVRTPMLDVAAATFERAIDDGYGALDFSVVAPCSPATRARSSLVGRPPPEPSCGMNRDSFAAIVESPALPDPGATWSPPRLVRIDRERVGRRMGAIHARRERRLASQAVSRFALEEQITHAALGGEVPAEAGAS